jgi:hypothetical protein
MKHFDDRTVAYLDVVLEDACRQLPHGGKHSFRKRVARKLLSAARRGNTTLSSLTGIARVAANEAIRRRPASRAEG